MTRVLVTVAMSAVAAFGLAACGSEVAPGAQPEVAPATGSEATSASVAQSQAPEAETAEPEASPDAGQAVAQGGPAADLAFTATTLDGQTFDGTTLAGKPALLWFWAPWCPTCAGQAAHMSEVAAEYDGEITVVGVGGLGQADAMRVFVDERGVDSFVHLSDEAGAVWQRFGITAQSTYVVLDAAGAVVAEGSLSEDELDAALASVA